MAESEIQIKLCEGPLKSKNNSDELPKILGYGANVVFEGVVRPNEEGNPIAGLRYEAYEPMTSQELSRLAKEIYSKHGIQAIYVEHSIGIVATGEISFRLTIKSAHRKEAIAAMDEFIDKMKQQVPLWKNVVEIPSL